MIQAALLFSATFAVVFFLGLQQLNVSAGDQLAAFVTSFAISGANLILFKVLPGPTGWMELAAYFVGGSFGIVASMRAHPRLRAFFASSEAPSTLSDWNQL